MRAKMAALALFCYLVSNNFTFAQGTSVSSVLGKIDVTPSPNELPSSFELKEGDTRSDEKTSHAVEAILRHCAEAYRSARHFRASGRYIQAYKSKRLGENLNDAHLQVWYRRPDRLKIVFTGKGMEVSFIADGTTVSQINGEKREYIQSPQPDSLSAYSEEERAGEIADDETNCIPNSLAVPLLITPDPLTWLNSSVRQYVYEGVEDVKVVDPVTSQTRRIPCWRIKFVQDNPHIVVENWIDRSSWFLRKLSVIQAVNENGEFVESYAGASRARMRVVIYDEISTAPQDVPLSSMRPEIPRGYKMRPFVAESKSSPDVTEGIWSRLVRAAVVEKGEHTSVSLQNETGGNLLQLDVVRDFESRITALQGAGVALNGKPSILVGGANKQLSIMVGGTSEAARQLALPQSFDQYSLLKRKQAEPLIIAAVTNADTLYAYDLDGREQWNYRKEGTIESIATRPSQEEGLVYVGYHDGRGVRALGPDGKVRFASRRISMVSGLTVSQKLPAAVPVLVRSSSDIGCFTNELKLFSRFESETLAGPCEVDWEDSQYPIVGIGFTTAEDVLLQRASADGVTSWTMNLSPQSSEIKGAAVDFAALRIAAPPGAGGDTSGSKSGIQAQAAALTRCIVALLSDGRISLVSLDGNLLYRGQLRSSGTLANKKDKWSAFGLAIADLDCDGQDEIYTASDSQLLRLCISK